MSKAPKVDWNERAKSLVYRNQSFIGGKFVPAQGGATFDCVSPVDCRVLTQIASCGQADIDTAVRTARAAFESGAWSRAAPSHRKSVLVRLANLMLANREELALLETARHG